MWTSPQLSLPFILRSISLSLTFFCCSTIPPWHGQLRRMSSAPGEKAYNAWCMCRRCLVLRFYSTSERCESTVVRTRPLHRKLLGGVIESLIRSVSAGVHINLLEVFRGLETSKVRPWLTLRPHGLSSSCVPVLKAAYRSTAWNVA